MAGPPKEKSRDEIDMKLLRELAALPANKFCFDCGQRGPTYVNVTIGAFVCSSCGGLLRGLNPPHRVKSLTVCSFTELEMDRIKSRGNEYCTHIWLGKYNPKTENIDLSSPDKRKEFMILKYEEKKFYVDPREAIKKMKPRAPAVPSNNLVNSSVPRSQTALPNKQSTQVQKHGVLSQAFSVGDISSNAVPGIVKVLENDPFQEIKQAEKSSDGASFADFNSAFGNTNSKDSPTLSQAFVSSSSNSNNKKQAPPPPDRYAALADLDSQQHHHTEVFTNIPSSSTPSTSIPFWSAAPSAIPTATILTSGMQIPFQTPNSWPQVVPCPQNPFQVVTQSMHNNKTVFPHQQNTNGVSSASSSSLPNGNLSAVYWPQPWGGEQFQSQQPDPFMSRNGTADKKYNPWPQSFIATTANPFTNDSFGSGESPNPSGTANSKNPFL